MTIEKPIPTKRYDTLSRVHIIVLYLLVASLTIAWGIYFVYFSRDVQTHMASTYAEFNLIKERLEALESPEITIETNANGYDALRRHSRQARVKSKAANNKQQQQKQKQDKQDQQIQNPDLLFGSIHFKIPVRKHDIFK